MKVIVTGGTGFVGSNLACYFKTLGHEVVALDNFSKEIGTFENKRRVEAAGVKVMHLDIRNWNDVEHFFRNQMDVGAILHVAAQVAFKRSVENPRLDFEVNALGTFNLLEALRLYQPQAVFVCASTNQVYGQLSNVPLIEYEKRFDYADMPYGIPETFPLDFLSPYGCSKGAADQYTTDYARIYGLKTVVARLGGIYGDWQYSYEDHGWVAFMTKMVVLDQPFNRHGHGKQVRDVLYISDICRAIDLLVEKIETVNGLALNIAGGPANSLSILELLDLLESITGHTEKSTVNPMRIGDKVVCYLDIRKAQAMLGWAPTVSAREGIMRLVEWTQKHVA